MNNMNNDIIIFNILKYIKIALTNFKIKYINFKINI